MRGTELGAPNYAHAHPHMRSCIHAHANADMPWSRSHTLHVIAALTDRHKDSIRCLKLTSQLSYEDWDDSTVFPKSP